MAFYSNTQMKRLTIILTIILLSAFTSCGQTRNFNNVIVYTVDFKYMEGCETGNGDCNPVILKRRSLQDSVTVIFPSGGTQSDVYLYTETAFIKWIKGKPSDQPKPLSHDQKFAGQGNPTLDLTGLRDGVYRPHMLSCGVGGTFELTIVTEK